MTDHPGAENISARPPTSSTDSTIAPHPWWLAPAAAAAAGLLRLLGRSWRITPTIEMRERDALLARGDRCIFALWHARLLPLVFTHRGRGVAVLISRHRDGELIARVVRHLGYATARGSSTRGGEEGARSMFRHADEGRLLAVTPDGPRGPAARVKAGLVWLASRTGFPVLPVAAAASSAWRLRSWDGFLVPKPGARVVIGYGEPIAVPRELDDAAAELWRETIERAMTSLTADLDRRAREPR